MATLPQELSWVGLEMKVAQILTEQEIHGWAFDERAAQELEQALRQELDVIRDRITTKHPFVQGTEFVPKRNNSTKGYFTGAPSTRLVETNIGSRDHIAWILQTFYGWKPKKMTETGKPVVDEIVLKELKYLITDDLAKALETGKYLGMLTEGSNAWLKLVRNGRIHHRCQVATNTHRCAHSKPNLAQVPSDVRFRRLFIPSDGSVAVGADLSGIELRMLAHYLHRYDGGRYAEILLNGDIHQVNADKIGISRRDVKTVTYAFLYGAGDAKIGISVDPMLKPTKAAERGREIRQAYMDAIDGLENLVNDVKKAVEARGYVKAIDGRRIPVGSAHKGLNYLLQSGAGVVAKQWMVHTNETIKQTHPHSGIYQLAFIHDELQFECPPELANDLKFTLTHSALTAGECLGLSIKIEAEAKEGKNWAEVH